MRTNLTSELRLTDGSLTDQLTKRSRKRPIECSPAGLTKDVYKANQMN